MPEAEENERKQNIFFYIPMQQFKVIQLTWSRYTMKVTLLPTGALSSP